MSNLQLAAFASKAENGAVFQRIRFTVWAIALLCVCFCAAAQNEDRDRYHAPATSANAPSPESRVDINHATLDELLKVPGMTPSWAGRIVRFRPYRAKSDLLDRGIVPNLVYERIKDFVVAHRDPR